MAAGAASPNKPRELIIIVFKVPAGCQENQAAVNHMAQGIKREGEKKRERHRSVLPQAKVLTEAISFQSVININSCTP